MNRLFLALHSKIATTSVTKRIAVKGRSDAVQCKNEDAESPTAIPYTPSDKDVRLVLRMAWYRNTGILCLAYLEL